MGERSSLAIPVGQIAFETGGGDQGRRIDDFEPLVGKANDLLFAQDLEGPADMDVSKAQRLADVALAQRQVNRLARLVRKTVVKPDIDLKQ